VLRQAGIENFLVHGGQSSILAAGSRAVGGRGKEGWTVALRHPLRPDKRMAEIRLHDRALGTSGSGVQFFHYKGRRYGHVLDPRTGWPVEGVLSATVIAPTAAQADALSTAFYVMGLEKAKEYCNGHEEIATIMVCPGQRSGSISLHSINLDDDQLLPLSGDDQKQ
jgi:thiamine biosynthesis lipoprotein